MINLLFGFILGIVLSLVVGYFVFKKVFVKKIKEKIISRDLIINLFSSVGKKPSEQDINRFINILKRKV